jgi:hypothetical protein
VPKQFDVIRVQNLSRVTVQNQMLLMLKEPIDIVFSDVQGEIGAPKDILKNLAANGDVNFDQQIAIPVIGRPSVDTVSSSTMQVDHVAPHFA